MDDKKNPLASELHNLGKMRKLKGNDAFKNILRAKLNDRAEELESKPKRSWNFNWKNPFTKRFIPAVSVALVAVIMLQVLVGPGGLNLPIELVNVAEAQDYYTLTPSDSDDGGVDPKTRFTLSSKGDLNADDLLEVLTVTPETTFSLEQVDSHTVSIIPDLDLETGDLYQFELAAQNLDDAPYKKTFRWAYSVSDAFRVTGTHPGNEVSNVPINTGIEISVTHLGVDAKDFQSYFSISPEVSGDFDVENKTLIFIPSENLLENTIYTVTLGAALPLAETDQTLGKDYIWQFETNDEASSDVSLNVDRFLTIAPDETSLIQAYAYDWNAMADAPSLVDVDIYAYDTSDEFLAAIESYRASVPGWTYAADEHYQASSKGLEHVLSSNQLPLVEQNYRDHIQLPQALKEGYYLMNVTFGSETEQSFVQVTNTATYMAFSPKQSIVWVNDILTGEPVTGAKVSVIGSDISVKTNADGLAEFDELYEHLNFEKNDNNEIQIRIESDRDITFYDKSFYNYNIDYRETAWGLFETDRKTYRPTDTVQFWGMVQGREAPLNGEATLYIVRNYFDISRPVSDIEDLDSLVDVFQLEIKDGELFEGELELIQYAEAPHSVYLVLDEKIILSDYLAIENYELPAYDLILSSNKTEYFLGETVTLDIEARFFDGTPVAHTDFRVNDPDEKDVYVTTDENGMAQVSWLVDDRLENCQENSYCSLSYGDSFSGHPVQEELADIGEWFNFEVYRSQIALGNPLQLDHDAWEFKAYEVDLEMDSEDYQPYFSYRDTHISDVISTRGSVSYTVERQDTLVTVTDYYDDVDKVTRQESTTETFYTQVLSGKLTPDSNGRYYLDLNLSESESYRIEASVYDDQGGFYLENFWVQAPYDGEITPYLSLNVLNPPSEGYSLGDMVQIEGVMNDESIDSDEDSFLFIQAQGGIMGTTVQNEGLYEFKFTEEYVPNVYITGVRFTGEAYQTTYEENIHLDLSDREFALSAKTDKDEYAPGDAITITIDAGQAAELQIQLVDEAYYSLYDEDLYDPLTEIYASLYSSIDTASASHLLESSDGGKGGCFKPGTQILMSDGSTKNIELIAVGDQILTRENEFSDLLVVAEVAGLHSAMTSETLLVNGSFGLTDNHIIFINGQWKEASKLELGDVLLGSNGERITVHSIETKKEPMRVYNFEVKELHTYFADGHYVHNDKGGSPRTDFPVTAHFEIAKTDAKGKASVSFTLPDSITAWRVSVSAVASGDEIRAGSTSAAVVVTKDAFAVPVLNTNYLVGDQPMLPIRAYGDALSQGDTTNFWLESESMELGLTAEGRAFETSYFELNPLTEGTHDFTFGLESAAGDDSIALTTEVVDSYFRLPQMEETLLSEGVSIPGSDNSLTEINFLNLENSAIYWNLKSALWQEGSRADQALGRSLAARWLNEVFGMTEGLIDFDGGVYQNTDIYSENGGGISLFPYSDADLELSALMAALSPKDWNVSVLREYFKSILYDSERTLTEKMQAIYGLTGLDENMILELTVFEREFELSSEDKLWAALAYSEMGAGDQVTTLYLEIAEEKWNANQTMLLATLADYISSDQREALYEQALDSDEFTLLSSLLYTKQRLTHISGDPVSFNLNGEKIEIEAGSSVTRFFNSNALDAIEISNVKGEILALSNFWNLKDPNTLTTSNEISIDRWYEVNGQRVDTLHSGDVVEVHFSLDIEYETGYRVVDYLPSGLQALTQPYSSWWNDWYSAYQSPYQSNHQELSFHVYCEDSACKSKDFYYIARVVNPGTFKAEPALLQEFSELDITTVSEEQVVVIQP